MRAIGLTAMLSLAACGHAQPAAVATRDASGFPRPDRPVSPVVSARWSSEPVRDSKKEADAVMRAAGVAKGMTVADIGAGEGYYTIRLASRVGPAGRVLAEDIVPAYHDALATRVLHDKLDNVSVTLGRPNDPGLPPGSFDRVFMVHMYHEMDQPYAVLWHLRPSLKAGGQIVVIDADRPTDAHGTPPALLDCEFRAVGYRLVRRETMPQADGYLALYAANGARPSPKAITACRA
jgi:ubiquinone/menaquinone biosynthesis C-methylase UbiE